MKRDFLQTFSRPALAGGKKQTLTVERAENISANTSRFTPDRFYDAYAEAAATVGIDRSVRDSVPQFRAELEKQWAMQDGAKLPESGVGYRQEITRNRNTFVGRWNDHIQAFGLDNSGVDPRADKVRRLSVDFAGDASRYCCGVPANMPTVDFKITETRRGWYTIGWRDCWQDRWSRSFHDFFGWERTMDMACIEILQRVHAHVTWNGDPVQGLRGVKDLPCDRITLNKPFDQMTFQEALDTWTTIHYMNELRYGNSGAYKKDAMLLPSAFGIVFAQQNASSTCCESLGEMMSKIHAGTMYRFTDWMNTFGVNGTAAMMLYNRAERPIIVDHAVGITKLPPVFDCGEVVHQWVMRLGEVSITDPTGALIVSNVLTTAC